MEYRSIIFYVALLVAVGCIAELYVRMNAVGEQIVKIKGVVVRKKPKLAPPFVCLIASIIVAALTIPH